MTELYAIILFITVLLFLLGTGVWVGLALMGVAWFGMELFTTRPVGDAMVTTIWASSSSWTLTALPLFIWMGEILFRTRLSEDMFKGLSPWLAKLPGGLVHTSAAPSLPPFQGHLPRRCQPWAKCRSPNCGHATIPKR